MWTAFKNSIRRCIPSKIREFIAYEPGDEFAVKSFAQEGEDILLQKIFKHSSPGFYVDVGAHHPFRFSNTKILYDMGWRGINIEPNPDVRELFLKYRPEDINLCVGISNTPDQLTYYEFNHPALNTFDKNIIQRRDRKPIKTKKIEVKPLKVVLENAIKEGQRIDLMTIDCEGYDFKVLISNNWNEYVPRFILIEIFDLNMDTPHFNPIFKYLIERNYQLKSKLHNTCLFALRN